MFPTQKNLQQCLMQKAMFNVAPLTIHSESCAIDDLKMTSAVLAALKSVRFFHGLQWQSHRTDPP
jgi:hypothetical protein